MYRILPKYGLFAAFAWLVLGLASIANFASHATGFEVKISTVPMLAWLALNAIFFNPIWRWLWRKWPKLNHWVFPDLNGIWEVELHSNWPRQLQMLEAAAGRGEKIDLRVCGEEGLAPLMPIRLRAEFLQTWWSFQIHMWNPDGETPIKDSVTTYVEPFRRDRLNPPGICYFFKQVSETANLADDTEFYGAARLTYDCATDQLAGLAWTSRMWLRAMNTAATITMKRPAVPTG